MKRRIIHGFLLMSCFLAALGAAAAVSDPVRVEQGLVAGTSGTTPDIRVFRGIPYAAPPVGDLRWKAPQPAPSWQGVRQAAEFSNACWQTPYPAAAAIYQSKLPPLNE